MKSLFISILLTFFIVVTLQAQEVQNGSLNGVSVGNNVLRNAPHWSVCGYSPDVCNSSFPSYAGTSQIPAHSSPDGGVWLGLASLNSSSSECASTTITGLVVGQEYHLLFYGACFGTGTSICNNADARPTVEIGTTRKDFVFMMGNGWSQDTLTFTATSSSMTMSIEHLTPQGFSSYSYASLDGFGIQDAILSSPTMNFSTELMNKQDVAIQWKKERAFLSCSLERSFDGVKFETVHNFKSVKDRAGSYVDMEAKEKIEELTQHVYYRLKYQEINGEYMYTEVQTVLLLKRDNSVLTVYPNPVVDVLNLNIKIEENTQIYIRNALGVIVHQENLKNGQVELGALVSGAYTLSLMQGGVMKVIPFIKS